MRLRARARRARHRPSSVTAKTRPSRRVPTKRVPSRPGHLPCIGDFREGLDDEALREMDGGEAIILDRPDRAEESGGEKQGQDESSHDPTHMWEARRLPNLPRQAGNVPASSQRKRDQRKQLPEGWCLPRPSSEESAPTRIFQVQHAVRTRRTTLGRSTAARPRR